MAKRCLARSTDDARRIFPAGDSDIFLDYDYRVFARLFRRDKFRGKHSRARDADF